MRARLGFRDGDRGTHSSRTIMLAEAQHLFAVMPPDATKADYWCSIVDDNSLGKRTGFTRRATGKHLRELYGLDPQIAVFRALRRLWSADPEAQPLLAFLGAFARDPLLRLSAPAVWEAEPGQAIDAEHFSRVLAAAAPERFRPGTLASIARNARSSWTQSGHLAGRVRKLRARARPSAVTAAYALFLGYLEGVRAQRLFDTVWVRLLDCPRDQSIELARAASQRGLLDFLSVGSIVEVRFPELLGTGDAPTHSLTHRGRVGEGEEGEVAP